MEDLIPTVSICCITYNHKKFISQAINSFLMQETNFHFDIIVADDCSNDGALDILKTFSDKYPDKIKLISTEKNLGTHGNLMNCLKFCTGKYIAICEGDDYWTDPLKLQKQVDFLENNSSYVICCHYTRVINENGKTLYVHPNPVPIEHTYYDLLAGRQEETKTATVVYRNTLGIHQLFTTSWFTNCYAGDKIFKLFATSYTGGKIFVMPQVMSCYRNHSGGVWSMISTKTRMERTVSDFYLIINHFTYPALQKRRLLMLYVRRYLLFELRNRQVRKAFNTVKFLLNY
jgi:glycosyltransferase involved in cell wall biosynthesis